MTDLVVPTRLANEIRQEAEAEGIEAETLLEAAIQEHRLRTQERKLSAEIRAWKAIPTEARAIYHGEYVAVHQGNVVDDDRALSALHVRIRAKYGRTAVLITPADGRPDLVFRSPRLERMKE